MKYLGENFMDELVAAGVTGPVVLKDGFLHGIEHLDPRERATVEQLIARHEAAPDDPFVPVLLLVNRLDAAGQLERFGDSLSFGDLLKLVARGRERASVLREYLSASNVPEGLYDDLLRPD